MGGLAKKLIASAGAEDKTYVDDIFSVYLRTGTGADTTVNTNIDMTKGYMLWTKGRSGATDHAIYDSARGVTLDLASNTIAAQTTQSTGLKSVSATGHTIGSLANMNTSGATYVDYVFRKAPKFFDVVTWTKGTNINNRIPHALGSIPGCIIIKSITNSSQWFVWHRTFSNPLRNYMALNTTDGVSTAGSDFWGASSPTATDFGINDTVIGSAGEQWVAYLFAHDTSADGMIQCGSYNGNGAVNNITLGWEPQWLLIKRVDSAQDWIIQDNMRGMPATSGSYWLYPNGSTGEYVSASSSAGPLTNSTGFWINDNASAHTNASGGTYIYLAIRRPNKPPTTGTQVYQTQKKTSTGYTEITGVGFAPDLAIQKATGAADSWDWVDKLRGPHTSLKSNLTDAENSADTLYFLGGWLNDGVKTGSGANGQFNGWNPNSIHFFRRAPGFFDVVCYTGTGAVRTVAHNLTVVPELMIFKSRSFGSGWRIYSPVGNASKALDFTNGALADNSAYLNGVSPTSSVFTLGGDGGGTNNSAETYVSYLFASAPGVSKIGSYIGNGTTQTINCGFTTGARFVLIKRTDSIGDWYVWDSARGIVAANDPYLSLNTTAAEVTTDDSVDPESTGFIVNQNTATNINVNGGSYIFLAIA